MFQHPKGKFVLTDYVICKTLKEKIRPKGQEKNALCQRIMGMKLHLTHYS